ARLPRGSSRPAGRRGARRSGAALAGRADAGGSRARGASGAVPGGGAGPGSPADRSAAGELLADDASGGADGGAPGGAPRERDRAVRAVGSAEAGDAAEPRSGQAHRESVGGGGAVLPRSQDGQAPA